METFEDLRDDIEENEGEEYSQSDVVRYLVYRLTQDEDGEWVEDYENPDEDACVYASSDYSETEEYAISYAKEHNCRTHIVICPVDRWFEDCSEGRSWWRLYADYYEPYEVIWESEEL